MVIRHVEFDQISDSFIELMDATVVFRLDRYDDVVDRKRVEARSIQTVRVRKMGCTGSTMMWRCLGLSRMSIVTFSSMIYDSSGGQQFVLDNKQLGENLSNFV